MRQETVTYYTFEELTSEAQEKAIEANRDINVDHSFWHECTIDDCKTIMELIGIEVKEIYFSGFSSQGDGACFIGEFDYKKGCLKSVKEYAPNDTELHQLVESYIAVQKRGFYQLSGVVGHVGHYYHSGCTRVAVCGTNSEDLQDDVTQALRDFMDWIYTRLEKEYEYLTSDDAVKETLIANEYEFLSESGEIQ